MRHSRALALALTSAAAVSFLGCASRGPRAVSAPGFGADLAAAYQGQARIVLGLGGKGNISLKRGARLAQGDCDVAVLVVSASLRSGKARFVLEPIGIPRIERAPARECRNPPREHVLVLSGLEGADSLEALSAEIDRVLLTPERFLAERGVDFQAAPAGKRDPVADKRLQASMEARHLAAAVKQPLQKLLSVAPVRRDPRKAVRYFGEVSFEAVVGVDGRPRNVRVAGAFADYAERITKAVDLWRFQPARTAEGPVAFLIEERTTLRIF